MNIFHQEPRFDCTNMAKCGIHSLSKCRRYKGKLDECKECELVKRKSKTLNNTEHNRKVCPHCGRELNITMFGIRKVYRKGIEYRCRASWCKICTAEASKQRYRDKVLKQLMGTSPNK